MAYKTVRHLISSQASASKQDMPGRPGKPGQAGQASQAGQAGKPGQAGAAGKAGQAGQAGQARAELGKWRTKLYATCKVPGLARLVRQARCKKG